MTGHLQARTRTLEAVLTKAAHIVQGTVEDEYGSLSYGFVLTSSKSRWDEFAFTSRALRSPGLCSKSFSANSGEQPLRVISRSYAWCVLIRTQTLQNTRSVYPKR